MSSTTTLSGASGLRALVLLVPSTSTLGSIRRSAAARVTSSKPVSWVLPSPCCSSSVFLITRRHLFPRSVASGSAWRWTRSPFIVLYVFLLVSACALGMSSGAVGRMCPLCCSFSTAIVQSTPSFLCISSAVPRCTGADGCAFPSAIAYLLTFSTVKIFSILRYWETDCILRVLALVVPSVLDPKVQIRYIDTKHQLADILTKGNFTRDEWNNLLHLFDISHFSSTCCAKNSSSISCTKKMATSKSTAMNLSSHVSTSSSSAKKSDCIQKSGDTHSYGKPESKMRRNSKSDAASSSLPQDAYLGGLMDTATAKLVATKEESGPFRI